MTRISLNGEDLSLEQVLTVARGQAKVALGPSAIAKMRASRRAVRAAVLSSVPTYGVNTGFGHLADVRIAPGKLRALQYNLLRSHAAGVGLPLGEPETRAVMLLRAHALALGYSGARPEVVRQLLGMLNGGLLPRIPSQGSVGASGDLAPLAHLALALIGEGEVSRDGRALAAASALRSAGLRPLELEPKEGLSLINGTQVTTAIGTLALLECEELLTHFDIAGAMSLEALKGSARPFDVRVHRVRPHPGQRASARNMRRLLARSQIMESHRDCGRVQDSYSLRCLPQVHGAGRDAASHTRRTLEIEVNSATDNPLVFPRSVGRGSTRTVGGGAAAVISGGNFHAHPVAAVLDYLTLAMTGVASISERRTERLVNPQLSGLPAFLAVEVGLNSGLMLAQVTAASLVSESKVLSHPASVDSIPTSANREDHVSMGPIAARKAAAVAINARRVVAIEILAAAQALDFLEPLRPALAVENVHRRIRREVAHMKRDRIIARDIEAIEALIVSGEIRKAAQAETGPLT